MTGIKKRKRGRPKSGNALTRAEIQQRYRERQYAKLAAEPNEPFGTYPFPSMDELFGNAPTLDDVIKSASPEFRGELVREAQREEAQQEREDDGSDD
jgi:hypothetical protein